MNRIVEPQPGRRPRGGGRGLLLLAAVLVVLFALNPGIEDFTDYALKDVSGDKLSSLVEGGGTFAQGIVSKVGKSLVSSITERENYYFFSVYKVPGLEESTTYVGLLKKVFFKL